jgi:isocitrate dehydrogenase (NAD+)
MSTASIVAILGDGIGPEIVRATASVVNAAVEKHGHAIDWITTSAGEEAFKQLGTPLPETTVELLQKYRLCLKGPLGTPFGGGYKSVNVQLRQMFDLYQCVRPIKCVVPELSRLKDPENIDFVIFRENVEGLYKGIEFENDDQAFAVKVVTRKGCQRIVRAAFEYAVKHGRRKVVSTSKPNILKLTDGLFERIAKDAAKDFPGIKHEYLTIDNCASQLVNWPEQFEVIVTLNLYGDILSEIGSALLGSVALAPGSNIGKDCAIFEATHGTAPNIPTTAGNPTALMLSAAMMLEHLGWTDAARDLESAVYSVLRDRKVRTGDLFKKGEPRVNVATSAQFGEEVLKRI